MGIAHERRADCPTRGSNTPSSHGERDPWSLERVFLAQFECMPVITHTPTSGVATATKKSSPSPPGVLVSLIMTYLFVPFWPVLAPLRITMALGVNACWGRYVFPSSTCILLVHDKDGPGQYSSS